MIRRGTGGGRVRGARVLLAGVVLLAPAACGSGEAAPQVDPVPAAAAEAADATATAELISVPWRLDGADGVLLEVRVAGTGCVSFQNLEVQETARTVTIEALALKDTAPGTFCSQEIRIEQAPQALEKPLGTRKLVHAPVSPAWDGPRMLEPDSR